MLEQLSRAVHETRLFHHTCSSQGRRGLSAGLLRPREGLGGASEQMASGRPALNLQGTLTAVFSTENGAPVLLPYQFRMEEIEGFRYRCRVSGISWLGAGVSPPGSDPCR